MAEASDDAWLQVDEMDFPPHFKKYKKEEHYGWDDEEFWILWKEDNEEPEHPPGFSFSSWELKEKIKVLLKAFVELNYFYLRFLVQFWEPVLIEGRTLLTTRHQPFAINSIDEGLCRYRVESENYNFYVDKRQIEDELGLLGRVFIHKLPEISPNIEYYTIKEYPQRQLALGCQITSVHAYPVLDPPRQSCIGVLEIAWSCVGEPFDYPYDDFSFPNEEVDLKIVDFHDHSYRQIGDDYEAFEAASEEIEEVLEKVCRDHNLLAQTWIVCSDCMSNASYTGQLLSATNLPRYSPDDENDDDFLEMCNSVHLREGQGVVGQALSSHGLIFYSDITQFSIVEYPLAHFTKFCGLRSSFAICLQSSRTGSQPFVLEFFLPSSLEGNKGIINLLHSMLGIMKLNFQTFKLASGKDWGEKLPIQFVDYHNGEKYDCSTLGVEYQITISLQSPLGTLQDEGDKAANAEQSNINCTSSHGNDTSKNLERPKSKTGIQLGLNDILPHAKKKIADAAEALNVSRSTLKRICREHNINRWPPRNIKENCSLPRRDEDGQQIFHPSYGMPSSSNEVLPTIAPTNSHDTVMPDVNFVNIKAKHINDVIKFKLLLSSGLVELQHEIAKRLKLTGGTYDIKYEDEEKDLVLIACDEDVQDWMRTCGSQDSNLLKIFLMSK